MGRKYFDTLVKGEHKLYSDYVLGRVSGVMHVLCNQPDEGPGYAHRVDDYGALLGVRCSQEEYDNFAEAIERIYPGLCEFDFKVV